MVEHNTSSDILKLYQELKRYISLQKRFISLDMAERFTVFLSGVAFVSICIALGIMILFFLSIALAFWIGEALGNTAYGFLCVSLIPLIILLATGLKRNDWIIQPIARFMIRTFLSHTQDEPK